MGKVVTDVVDAVVGGVVGFLVGGPVGAVIGAAAGLGVGVVSQALTPATNAATSQRLSATLDPDAYRKIVFGNTAFGTDERYYEVYGATGYDILNAAATHKVNSFGNMYIENELLNFDGSGNVTGTVQYTVAVDGTTTTTSTSNFSGALKRLTSLAGVSGAALAIGAGTLWSPSHAFTGCAYYALKYNYSAKAFPNGISSRITQVGEGALLYDPRRDSTVGGSGSCRANDQTTWIYSTLDSNGVPVGRNNALQMLWYQIGWRITNPADGTQTLVAGRGINLSDFNWPAWIAAANTCETEQYYTDMLLSTGDDHTTNEQIISAGACGILLDSGGLYSYYPATNDTSNIAVYLSADDIVSGVNYNPKATISSKYNQIGGSFIDPSPTSLYQSRPYPVISDPTYIAQDLGRKNRLNVDYQAVQNAALAQKLSRITLNRGRFTGQFKATFNLRALAATNWNMVALTFPGLGMSNKLFRIVAYAISPMGGVDLTLQEEDPSVYSGGTVTTLLPPCTGVKYDPRQILTVTHNGGTAGVGTVVGGVVGSGGTAIDAIEVYWDAVPGNCKRIDLQYKKHTDTYYTTITVPLDQTQYVIQPLQPNTNYDVAVRFVSINDVLGTWASSTLSTGAVTISSAGIVTYADGTPVQNLEPAQAGANVTGTNVATGITGQSPLATSTNYAYLSSIPTAINQFNTDGTLYAVNMSYSAGVTVNSLRPAEAGADVTGVHVATAITGQSPFATGTSYGYLSSIPSALSIQGDGYLSSSNITKSSGGPSLYNYFPATPNADKTSGAVSSGFAGQTGWATFNLPTTMLTRPGQNYISNAALQAGNAYWTFYNGAYVGGTTGDINGPYIIYQPTTTNPGVSYLLLAAQTINNISPGSLYSLQAKFFTGGIGAITTYFRVFVSWRNSSNAEIGFFLVKTNNEVSWTVYQNDDNSPSYTRVAPSGTVSAVVTVDIASASGNLVFNTSAAFAATRIKLEVGDYCTAFTDDATTGTATTSKMYSLSYGFQSDYTILTSLGVSSGFAGQNWGATASQAQAGNTYAQVGTNALINSAMPVDFSGFVEDPDNGINSGVAVGVYGRSIDHGLGAYSGYNVSFFQQWGTTVGGNMPNTYFFGPASAGFTGGLAALQAYGMPVSVNETIGISGFLAVHGGSTAYVRIRFFNTSGSLVSGGEVDFVVGGLVNARAGGRNGSNGDPANYYYGGGTTTVPSGAAYATWGCYAYATGSDTTVYIFVVQPQLVRLPPGQVAIPQYTPGPQAAAIRSRYQDDTGRVTDLLNGIPLNTAQGYGGVFSPYPISSVTSSSITTAATTYTYAGGSLSIGAATLSGLAASTFYTLFFDNNTSSIIAVSSGTNAYYNSLSRYLAIGVATTLSSGGGVITPPVPPGGGGSRNPTP